MDEFEKGDHVRLKWEQASTGTIVEIFDDQAYVIWDDSVFGSDVNLNDLEKDE